jgi:hypothetical protein
MISSAEQVGRFLLTTSKPYCVKEAQERVELIKRRGYSSAIKGDYHSLYISSKSGAVEYLASRIASDEIVIAELCCGVGVALGILALHCKEVVGVDNNKEILAQCKDNLKKNNVQNAKLILGDVTDESLLRKIKADIVIYDIPHWKQSEEAQGMNPDLKKMIRGIQRRITEDIVLFVPPWMSYDYIVQQIGICEYQKVFIDEKYDRNYVYLGGLVKQYGVTELKLSTRNDKQTLLKSEKRPPPDLNRRPCGDLRNRQSSQEDSVFLNSHTL